MPQISVNPEQLDKLANTFVEELSFVENLSQELTASLLTLVMNCDPRYSHSLANVGDAWYTFKNLQKTMDSNERYIRNTTQKMVEEDNTLSKLYNFYDKYQTIVGIGGLAAGPLKYLAFGPTRYLKDANKMYSAIELKYMKDLGKYIDDSSYKNMIRGLMSPRFLFGQYKNKSIGELLHKKLTSYLPEDLVNFTNESNRFRWGIPNDLGKKVNMWDVIKSSKGFAKSNAISAFLVTGATESVGAGITIAENFDKYKDKPEVLKRENAKAVGEALNKTVMVTAGSTIGAVAGGALGSFAGPVGTVVGGTVGSVVGGMIGEQASKLTAGVFEWSAVKLKDPIHAGIKNFRGGLEKAGKGVAAVSKAVDTVNKNINKGADKVMKTASSLANGAKEFFSKKLSFG